MNRLYQGVVCLLLAVLCSIQGALAQLPDGSIAPDFTAVDINGIEHNLFSVLNQGKTVIINFGATWVGPCWNYHMGGALQELYLTHGPEGTDEIEIFFIESDDSTPSSDLYGETGAFGNWVVDTPYPIIDDGGWIFSLYDCNYYPTLLTICPEGYLFESGQLSAEEYDLFLNNCSIVGTVDVTFQVDLSNYSDSYDSVNLGGDFNGWCGTCVSLVDSNQDLIYEVTVPLIPGATYQYKYSLGGWENPENLDEGGLCTVLNGGFVNRVIEVGPSDIILDPVCFSSCSECQPIDSCFAIDDDCSTGSIDSSLQASQELITGGYIQGPIWNSCEGWSDYCPVDSTTMGWMYDLTTATCLPIVMAVYSSDEAETPTEVTSCFYGGVVTETPLLYAENVAVTTSGNASEGGLTDTLSCGSFHESNSQYGLIIEVDEDAMINHADVLASQTGQITITYHPETDTINGDPPHLFNSKSFFVDEGWNRLDLNIPVVGSNKFKLSFHSTDGTQLYREQSCADFPMPIGDIGEIIGTNAITFPEYYYYFYNISMSELELTSCTSDRFPLEVDWDPFLCGDPLACNFSPEVTEFFLWNCCFDPQCQSVACQDDYQSVEDELPWSNSCAVDSCYEWVFGNGSGAIGEPWEGVDLNFVCSLDGPSGPYNQWAGGVGDFSPAPVMSSTTSSNGVLIVDSDLYGAEENYSASWVENSWVQTAEPINCSATEFVRMSFQTRYRCWDNGASDDSEKCLVEVSRDGVNWPDIATFSEEEGFVEYGTGELVPSRWEVFPDYQTGSQTENPSIINLDISPAAGGQDEVWIRFRWSGTWGFSWEIDDIIVAAIPENDLEIGYVSTTDYLNTGDLELGAVPLGQLTTHQAGVAVVNTGLADQNQISVGLSSAGQSLGASEMTTIANGTETLFQFDYSLVGLDTGMHLLEFEIQNDGSPWWDESPDDNIQAKSIEVTEYQMGRDDGVMTGSFPTDEADNFSVINPFQIYENDTVYAIDVAFAEGSALTSDLFGYLQVGQSMEDVNYAYANVVTGAGENAVGEQMLNAPGDSIIKWTTLLLDEPLAVAAGDWVGAVIESYAYPEPVRIGLAQDVYPNTCFVEGPFGSGDSWGSYYIPTAPMIRLNFDSNALASGWGCLDEASCNYNPNAFEPYLDCDTTSCAGCLDPIACNFDPSFTLSNSEYCTYPGCQDPSANNYDPEAGCEGECNYLSFDCSSIGEESWSNEAMGLFPEWQTAMHGMEWFGEWVLNIPATIIEPSSGVSYAIHHMNWMAVEGLPDWVENVTYDLGELDVSSQHCISAFGTPSEQGIYEVTATGEVYISIFGQPFSIGEQSFSAWLEVAENPNPIPGCTYPTAQNFLAFATMDDGSCEFAGCTDPEAGNFNPLATIDDGSCGEGCDPASDPSCQADNDGDGLISVSDLLILLGEFGSTCE